MKNSSTLSPAKDPMGAAIADYFHTHNAAKLRVFSPQFEEDEMPVTTLFRPFEKMPSLERKALEMAEGKILDVGAGSGCHALALQEKGKDVLAIDISPQSVHVMSKRGVRQVRCANFFDETMTEQFDTLLMLMNGIGMVGTVAELPNFFARLQRLLKPNGQLLTDSTDLRYLFENEDGSFDIDLTSNYYGEQEFQMQYRKIKGDTFPWLYIDFETLSLYAAANGFNTELIEQGSHYEYLARITAV
ncbi:MAG: class I SAM-dependent methyltransferase [Bacteroidaceae bacterium]